MGNDLYVILYLFRVDDAIKPTDINLPISVSSLNIKALKVIHHYMENVKNNLSYYHGYISSSAKLKAFLSDYRKVTYTSFTVRSSRSYIKKRAISALKSISGANDHIDFNVSGNGGGGGVGGGHVVPQLSDVVTNFDNQQNENLMNAMNCGDVTTATTATPVAATRRGKTRKRHDDSLDDVQQAVGVGGGMEDDGNMLTGKIDFIRFDL